MSTVPYLETACSKRETICLYSSTLHDWKEALLIIICIIRRLALKKSELNWRVPSSCFDLRSSFLCSHDVDVTNYNVRAADGAVFCQFVPIQKDMLLMFTPSFQTQELQPFQGHWQHLNYQDVAIINSAWLWSVCRDHTSNHDCLSPDLIRISVQLTVLDVPRHAWQK